MTQQFIDTSAKYQALTQKQKTALDAQISAACAQINQITPKLTAKQKSALVAAYDAAVDVLAKQGWLTSGQATRLKTLASAI